MKIAIYSVLFFSISLCANAQHRLHGLVTNTQGLPLMGATINIDESNVGSVSDDNGEFQMRLREGWHAISVKYLGYKTFSDSLLVHGDTTLNITLELSPFLAKEFVVEATKAGSLTPMTFENIDREKIEANNLGQDLPLLLNQAVSVVTTSDAGAGVGYTGMRIRGSDATRINVTVNGVPLNDAESHGVFWVNMPDFASSTQSLQIQRGVGTSSNGAAAFGATINLETSGLDSVGFAEFNNSYGSFNTRKHNAILHSGLIGDHFVFEGRLSYISSDGYIDRSASDLRSYYMAGAYHSKKLLLKAITFSGKEITQQAWWGTPQSRIENDEQGMLEHAMNNGYSEEQTANLLNSGRTYNYYQYDNEIDHYQQDHYQLVSTVELTPKLYLNLTGHYTRGLGYFEQSKKEEDFADFGLPAPVVGTDTIASTDFIVRRWLDNHFFGGVYSLQYRGRNLKLSLGGGVNQYLGDHYGEIIWAGIAESIEPRERYYFSASEKLDASSYLKANWTLSKLTLFGDIQGRYIDYSTVGIDNDQRPLDVSESYAFFNPKGGLSYRISGRQLAYFSVARASREPVRSDFTDAVPGQAPRPEFLTDFEAGWSYGSSLFNVALNGYYMHYKDQLVLTGEVNDVGAPVRTNVDESYRAGLEFVGTLRLSYGLYWSPNATLSRNKIVRFDEVIYDYTTGFDIVTVAHNNTDIAFSPAVIGGSEIGWKSKFGFHVALLTKYVHDQFLDNTSNPDRLIDAYLVNDLRLGYELKTNWAKTVEWTLLINNIANAMYESNGYTYSYIYGAMITENFYYPQAGTNFLTGLKLRF